MRSIKRGRIKGRIRRRIREGSGKRNRKRSQTQMKKLLGFVPSVHIVVITLDILIVNYVGNLNQM